MQRGKCGRIKITFDVRVELVTLIKFAPASLASALAVRVFPVPGGPNSNNPLQGWHEFPQFMTHNKRRTKLIWEWIYIRKRSITRNRFPWVKSSGLLIGRIISSSSAFFTCSRAPMSSNFTPISPGGTTAEMILLSCLFSGRYCYHIYNDWNQHKTKTPPKLRSFIYKNRKINNMPWGSQKVSLTLFPRPSTLRLRFQDFTKGKNKQMSFKILPNRLYIIEWQDLHLYLSRGRHNLSPLTQGSRHDDK